MQAFTKTYKSGTHLFHENDHSRELYIIQSGMVRVYRKIGARDVDLALLSKGAVLGEMALIDGKPRSASALAGEDTTVIMIDADTFHKRISGVPPWFLSMIRTTSEKIRKANSRLEAIQSPGHCLHVALALQYFFARYGASSSSQEGGASSSSQEGEADAKGVKVLDVSETAGPLGQLLSVNHQCIMQMLSSMQKNGIVDVSDGRIVLSDQSKMDGFCEYLRHLFRKSYDKMGKVSARTSVIVMALREIVGGSSEKTVEIGAADMAAACEKAGEATAETSPLESLCELKELEVCTFTKSASEKADAAAPLAGYQFFVSPAAYRKLLLYCTYKDMVPAL